MLQTTNPFQHWRRIITDRKVEKTEPAGIRQKNKKLSLLEKRRTFLTELRKEEAAIPPSPEGEGFLAASL